MLTTAQCQFFWRNNEQSNGEHLSGVIDHCTFNTSVCLPDLIRELPYVDLLHNLNVTQAQCQYSKRMFDQIGQTSGRSVSCNLSPEENQRC